jgi:hypothetical protein
MNVHVVLRQVIHAKKKKQLHGTETVLRSSLGIREHTRILLNHHVHYYIHESPPHVPFLSQINIPIVCIEDPFKYLSPIHA